MKGITSQEFPLRRSGIEWFSNRHISKKFFYRIACSDGMGIAAQRESATVPKNGAKKGKNMSSRKTFLTAIIIGGTVGLAPVLSWPQDAPGGTRQSTPERSGPGANVPETRSGAAQELSVNDMKLIQLRLQEKGYDPGNVNGTADETTRAAIRKFQQDQGIPVTGTIDERTANELGFQYSANPTDRGGASSDRPAPSEQPSAR